MSRRVRRKVARKGKGNAVSSCPEIQDEVADLEAGGVVDWRCLPDDTVIQLLSCLSYRDRASLSATCKTWRVLGNSPCLWSSLDLRSHKFDANVAASLASRCVHLQKLRFRGADSADALLYLRAKNLREISGDGCRKMTDATLAVVVARHELLESLVLGPDFCDKVTSDAIRAIAHCCPSLMKLRLSGIRDVNADAINALANYCPKLTDIGFIDCLSVDELALGNVQSVRFLSVAGTPSMKWNVVTNLKLPNLIGLDVSRTDIGPSAVSRLLSSSPSLRVLIALNCPILEEETSFSASKYKNKLLISLSTDIFKGLASLFSDNTNRGKNVFLDWRTSKTYNDKGLDELIPWLEWMLSHILLRSAESPQQGGLDNFWVEQGASLLLSLMQSSQEDVQERAATGLATFVVIDDENASIDCGRAEAVMRDGGIRLLLGLAKSYREGLQSEAAKAIANLSVNANVAKAVAEEGGIEILASLARSMNKLVAEEAAGGLWNLSVGEEHKGAIAEAGGVQALVDLIFKWSSTGDGVLERAAGALANLAADDKCMLLGYLGRYFKDIQKQQLKIRLEEVLLENVELILEAFDYLQLPFALNQGRVGKLSIKIPWKKPWDPIIIILEDVFISASKRDDHEWNADAVERREFAGKKAKLAAAELGKLSRRVSGGLAGQSFISHVTAKILDSIQVDIRNFHVLYSDAQNDLGNIMFGLKFSNLTMKQNLVGASVTQVKKIVEVKGLEMYSSLFHSSTMDLVIMNTMGNSYSASTIGSEGKQYNSILAPFDVTLILSANRSQKLDDNAAQYSVTAELSGLVISLDEVQLQQMFLVWDYVCTCRLREKYGRFRPWHCPLPTKQEGWQILWWHYAQEAVLSDVRKKLKKTSWKYFGDRLSYRRKYMNLYKIKLDFLQQEQPVDDDVLQDLEQMEKETDLDDILNYRSAAEFEMQEYLSRYSTPSNGRIVADISTEKSGNDEHNVKSRGWLNWLSRGMLGAGGTDDSSQFSGVVSYDVKDISEATEFHPLVSSSVDVATKHELCIFESNIEIHQISVTLFSKKHCKGIAEIIFEGGVVESKLYKEHGIIISKFNSGKMVEPNSKETFVQIRQPNIETNVLDFVDHSCCFQVNFSSNRDMGNSVKGMLQQLQVTFDANILLNVLEFYGFVTSVKSYNERVLLSLNGIENDTTRLLSKAEYVGVNHGRVMWDVSIFDISVNFPWRNTTSECSNMVITSRSLCFKSKIGPESFLSEIGDQPYFLKNFSNTISTSNDCSGVRFQDLYNYIDVKLNDFKITIVNSDQSQKISILEKFAASFFIAFCVIPDESILKQLEVYMLIESLKVHFSPSIYGAFIELRTHMDSLLVRGESEIVNCVSPSNIVSDVSAHSTFGISIISRLGSVDLEVDLENRGDKSSVLMVSLQEIYVRYASAEFQELFISTKSLMIRAYEVKEEKDDCFVLLSVNLSSPSASVPAHSVPGPSIEFDQYPDDAMLADACFAMHYESPRTDLVCHKCFIYLNNADIHCYPHIVGLVVGFFHRLSAYSTSSEKSTASNTVDISKSFSCFGLQKFGFSNYFEVGYADSACIPFDCFPFVTIYNSGPLDNLESSLIYAIPDWRKYFTLRDRKIISPKSFRVSSSKCKSDFGNLLESGIARISNNFSIELQLFGIRAHFHDSSCIIGSITIPTCKSSLSFCDDNMDILSSSEGLVLTSSWGPHNFQDYLWGPATANLSPILNVRVRKTQNKSSAVDLEVCFGIQHVYCMLPSEYLSIIIGYFSLSDWGGYSGDQFPSDEQGDIVLKNEMNITYKFEILDSDLVLPVENNEHQFLKLELPQIYCSFIVNSGFDDVLKNIPTECLVPTHKLAQRNNCLNIFGRDLNISFLLYTNNILGLATNEWNTEFVTISLITPLNADVWVRIPRGGESNYKSSSSICLMTCISSCHIIAEDIYFFDGCMALWDVIEGFSSVDDQSNCFKTDVLQFLQSKRSLKATGATSSTLMPSNSILTEVKCCTQSLMISFCHSHEGFVEPLSKGDLQFTCSASLVDDSLVWLDLRFSRLVIFSSHDSVLAKCASTSCSMFVLGICFSKSIDSMNELSLCLSSLDIWLHLSEWTEIVNFLNHLYLPSEKTPIDAASEHLSVDTGISIKEAEVKDDSSFHDSKSTSIPFTIQENENAVLLIIRSENVRITFHIPIWTSEEPHVELQHAKRQNLTTLSAPSDILEEKDAEFLTVSIEVNGFELVLRSRDIQLKSNMERLSSVMTFVVNGSHTSLPLLDIVQVHMDAVLSKSDTGNTTVNMELICDHSDVWLSHPAFYLWGALKFDGPKSESSQNSTGSISFKFQARKVSVLLTDGKWSYNGPQLEILVRSILFHASACGKHLECSFAGDLQVNYKNIGKVAWEPFVEPWHFLFTMVRDQEISILPNRSLSTDIILESTTQLNINITESLVECVSRTAEMLDDALGLMGLKDHEGNKLLHPPCSEYIFARKCVAPYVIQNLTSAPLLYHVYHGHINPNDIYDLDINHAKCVQPGSASTIYMDENAEQLSHYRPYHSSDSLNEQRSSGLAHRYIMVQLEGTSVPSNPISMDLVGLTCFDANFSKSYNENGNDGRMNSAPTFVVPVVLDVSALRYSKLIRVYSTVVLLNATSTSLELRFDIPFGVAPRIFDPIHPGQQFPLPLHLAEAGCVRWRPVGNSYLWSEAHKLSNLLSLDTKVGNFKSFICYPSHPSSHPFRCCISVKSISLTSSGRVKNNLLVDDAKKHYIHHLILSAPLVINNFLPKEILLISKSGGVDHTARISEVKTSIYHIDPSHDLGLEICIDGFKCCDFKFPRLETFCTVAKFSETKFSLSETLIFESNNSSGHNYVTAEKVMDAYSGSRELIIFVPFILYNCMGFPLCVKEASSETDERGFVIPSYYDVGVNETFSDKKDGLSLLASNNGLHAGVSREPRSYLDSHTISCRKDDNPNSVFFGNYRGNLGRQKRKSNSSFQSSSFGRLKNTLSSGVQSTWNYSGSCNNEHERVVPCMYSPSPTSSVNDVFVKMSGCFPKDAREQMPYSLWSNSFSLLPQSGSSTIFVPHLTSNSAFILAVTSISVAEPYGGRTNAIAFQPRYVISNACSKEIIYKQKGTDVTFYLGVGEHAHLHWTDTSRELLVSICYNETGWQWSGSFLPDHLGDTQLKMRNFVLGTSSMIRVEVQNADISMGDEKIVGNIKGNSGTNLILLSDDDTGYMPYRIDNFSKEILRIYQQRCEVFDTVIHSYASNPYTWDEPSYPHRLVVEVPGERVLGMYALDDVKEYMPVHLPSTSEKPERIFFVSVHAEGATKVLSVLDSNYHIFNEVKKPSVPNATEKRLYDHNQVRPAEYKDKISISIPCIGISLINSYPQELLFACINDIQINLLQSLDRQRLSMRISFIQIDNQLRSTPYPVMLSFNGGYRSRQVDYTKFRDDATRSRIEKSNQMNFSSSSSSPVFCLEISKWKKKDTSFLSFEHIKLRMADFRLEIEQEVILSLFEFFTNISSGMHYGTKPSSNQYYGTSLKDSSSVQTSENFRLNGDQSPLGFAPIFNAKSKKIASLPSIVPIGAPWQEIYLLARTQKKVYIEMFELAPLKLTLSFSSAPWMLRNRILTSKEFLIHRGLMALADVEGAHIYLKDITIAHHTASWESIQEILIRHYNRQLLHETYKLFGSAGVIGNPLGFARSMGHGIRDFLSVPANNIMRSPTGLIMGMAEGTTSLLSNTLYAVSDAASQFSKVARKGIVAFTYDDQIASRIEKQQATVASDSKGVINEVLEGLTGLLQSPIRGAEKHGLPGVLSGVALGITGLVAKPAASILEVTGKTAQSIRNRSKPNQLRSHRFRVRLPRSLSHEFPLRSYSWDEAVGASVLVEADDGLKFKDEKLMACKALKEAGKFVVLTERYIMTVFSPSLRDLGKPEFCGIPSDLEWIIEWEIGLESIIHADCAQGVIHIVGSRPDSSFMHDQHSPKRSSKTKHVRYIHYPTHLPLPQTDIELAREEDAANLLQLLLSGIEKGKVRAWDCGRILHRANMKQDAV